MRVAILANGKTVDNWTRNPTLVKKYDQVWGLNQQATWKGLKLDKLFVMDDLKLRMPFYAGYDLTDWLKTYPGPIITSKAYEEWPTSEAYPIVEICHYFGLPLGTAMYSTPDYMIALAIYMGAKRIDLFGVDMMDGNKNSMEMLLATAQWIGAAAARGVLVRSFHGSAFQWLTNPGISMENGLYGYVRKPRVEELVNTSYYQEWLDREEK